MVAVLADKELSSVAILSIVAAFST